MRGCGTHHMNIHPCLAWGLTTEANEFKSRMTPLSKVKNLKRSFSRLSLTQFFNTTPANKVHEEQIREMLKTTSRLAIEFIFATKREEDATY